MPCVDSHLQGAKVLRQLAPIHTFQMSLLGAQRTNKRVGFEQLGCE
jgi:hypothetical protein